PMRGRAPPGGMGAVARGLVTIRPPTGRVPEPRTATMSVSVRIPTTLRPLSGGQSEVSLEGSDVRSVIANLDGAHPGFADRLLDDEGNLRRFVNVFVADDDIRFLDGLATPVPHGGEGGIIPAAPGGW